MPADIRLACPVLEGVGAHLAAGAMAARRGLRPAPAAECQLVPTESTMRTNVPALPPTFAARSSSFPAVPAASASPLHARSASSVARRRRRPRRGARRAAATEIAGLGAAATLGVAIDVRREEITHRLVQATLERFGRIDALIVCAGILRKRGTAPKLAVDTGVANGRRDGDQPARRLPRQPRRPADWWRSAPA